MAVDPGTEPVALPASATATAYLDEEECLGIDVFVNELELLVATARQLGRVEQARLLELLPKLAATTPRASNNKAGLKALQKRCEPAFTELIATGVCPTVRRLICVCLTRFYIHADMLSIYARVSQLQTTLNGKDPGQSIKPISDGVRVCMLDVLSYLALHHGRQLTSAASENMAIASKSVSKGSIAVRLAGLRLAAATAEGMNSCDRSAPAVQAEAWALFLRCARDRTCSESRAGGAAVLAAVARAGGATLWRDGGYYWDEAVRMCIANLPDPSQTVRDAYAMALCDLAVAVRLDTVAAAIKDEQRPAKKAALEKLRADNAALAVRTALQQPLVDAALSKQGDVVASLGLAWVSYIGYAASHTPGTQYPLVELAVQVVLLCDAASRALIEAKAQGLVQDSTLGGALAGGEIPHVQAAVLYILRTAVVEALSEAEQRLLVARLAQLLARPSCPVPTAVVALEGLTILLDVLGEVSEETGASDVEAAILAQVTSASTPARQLASLAAGALAAAQPARAAALLSGLLDQLDAATELLGGVKTASMGRPAYDALMGRTQPVLMATAHGAALAAASVLMVSCQLPLSIPSGLPRRAYSIASALVRTPHADTIAPKALEREAGYIVLGALISCWGAGSLSIAATIPAPGGAKDVLGLLALALGEGARRDLDEHLYTHPGGDGELAMELWWRSVALQATRTYVSSLLLPARLPDASAQTEQVAELLAPLFIAVDCQQCMHDPAKSKGGPAGLLAACSGTFLLRLLECAQLLDLTRLPPASQSLLIKMCTKPVKAAGIAAGGGATLAAAQGMAPAAVAAAAGYNPGVSAALHRTALRYCLAREDSALGPWPTGRDTAEDELHDFAGERGAPHQQPWEPPLLTSLFTGVDPGQPGVVVPGTVPVRRSRLHGCSEPGGLHTVVDTGATLSVDRPRGALYPQALGLSPGLLAAQAAVLGRLLGVMSQGVQLQILEELIITASAGKGKGLGVPTDRDAVHRRHAAGTLTAIAALAGLMPLMRKGGARGTDSALRDKLANKVLHLANALMDGGGAADLGLARAAAQLLAASACLGTDTWAVKVVHAVVEEVTKSAAEGRDPERRAALCLALGCIHRAKGGLALQAAVPASVGALLAAVKRPVAHTALWALHALTLVSASAGAGYTPHVRVTLQLCQDLLVSGYESPGLRPATARLANSMVGVLGPDFTLGSSNYQVAKSLTTDMVAAGVLAVDDPHTLLPLCGLPAEATAPNGGAGGGPGSADLQAAPRPISGEALACELQAVLFAQQAILFAPGAVQASKHIPMLQATLLSRRPALRRAAAATLFHLSQRDPALLVPTGIEGAVFASLDGEANADIAAHLRGVLTNLLACGAVAQPAHWLTVLSEVVFSSGEGAAAAAAAGVATAATAGNGAAGEAEDEDEDGDARMRASPAKGASPVKTAPHGAQAATGVPTAAANGGGSTAGLQALLATVALRLRTRLFAADLLLSLVQQAAPGGRQGTADSPTLVSHLQVLVDLGFRLSTGGVGALRPAGVILLDSLLRGYASVEDPLMPGARLLEQYQAQLVSALRAALAPEASPALAMTGGRLAVTYLESGLAAGDAQVLQRLMDLLTGPLAVWAAHAPGASTEPAAAAGPHGYAEWVGVHQRVALLRAHAQCAALQRQGSDPVAASVVETAQLPYRPLLTWLWTALLQDFAVLASQPPAVHASYTSALLLAAASGGAPTSPGTASRPASQSGAEIVASNGVSSPRAGATHGLAAAAAPAVPTMSADIVGAVRTVYEAAVPAVLEAVTSVFPVCDDVVASQEEEAEEGEGVAAPPALWRQYGILIDVAVMLVVRHSTALQAAVQSALKLRAAAGALGATPSAAHVTAGVDVAQITRLTVFVQGLGRLLGAEYVAGGLAPLPMVTDVLHTLTALAQNVLAPLLWVCGPPRDTALAVTGLASAVADVVREVAQGAPAAALAGPLSPSRSSTGGKLAPEASEQVQQLGAPLLEAVLAVSSVTAPFAVQAGVFKPLSQGAALPDNGQQALDQGLVTLLVAATLLLRKAPAGEAAGQFVPALLQLCTRLLRTARPGMQLQASQRFLGTLLSAAAPTHAAQDAFLALASVADLVGELQEQGAGGAEPSSDDARVSACLTALASCAWHLPEDQEVPGLVRRRVLDSLRGAVSSPGLRRCQVGLEAVRASLQEGGGATAAPTQAAWAVEVLQALGPVVASTTQGLLCREPGAEGAVAEAGAAACEGLKALVAGASLAMAAQGAVQAEAVLWVVVALLVEAAAPADVDAADSALGPAPRELALRLLTSLPSMPLGPPFRTVVAALPAASKARLQAALTRAATAPAKAPGTGPAGAASSAAAPSIQLKSF